MVGVRTFPWATLAINLTGSFVLAMLLTAGIQRGWPENAVIPLAVGFLGAYTTFSTFSYETFTLGRADRVVTAAVYVAVSVAGGDTRGARRLLPRTADRLSLCDTGLPQRAAAVRRTTIQKETP